MGKGLSREDVWGTSRRAALLSWLGPWASRLMPKLRVSYP